ncbi:MAG: methyltransferase domain-containing protein [Bacteroidota bacterium]
MEIKRRPFQGVLNILSFNRHFYAIGLGLLALIITSHVFIEWSDLLYGVIIASFLYGLLMPLLVSAYVYDFSGYYSLHWLQQYALTDSGNNQLLNINAGFDETSFIIKKYFPLSHLRVFDFYNATQHTEPAIVRARKVSLVYPDTQRITTAAIPVPDQSVDIIFLLSAAHEIRSHEEKIQFLKECHRVCKPTGKVVMVEHLRDFPNFLAFSVGFTHFFSRKTWKNAFENAGFSSCTERKFTPFMSIFTCYL